MKMKSSTTLHSQKILGLTDKIYEQNELFLQRKQFHRKKLSSSYLISFDPLTPCGEIHKVGLELVVR